MSQWMLTCSACGKEFTHSSIPENPAFIRLASQARVPTTGLPSLLRISYLPTPRFDLLPLTSSSGPIVNYLGWPANRLNSFSPSGSSKLQTHPPPFILCAAASKCDTKSDSSLRFCIARAAKLGRARLFGITHQSWQTLSLENEETMKEWRSFLTLHSIGLYIAQSRLGFSMPPDYQDLGVRFQEIKEAYAQAKTVEEKQELLALAWEIVRQAEEQAAQLKSEIQRMKKS